MRCYVMSCANPCLASQLFMPYCGYAMASLAARGQPEESDKAGDTAAPSAPALPPDATEAAVSTGAGVQSASTATGPGNELRRRQSSVPGSVSGLESAAHARSAADGGEASARLQRSKGPGSRRRRRRRWTLLMAAALLCLFVQLPAAAYFCFVHQRCRRRLFPFACVSDLGILLWIVCNRAALTTFMVCLAYQIYHLS